MSETVLTSPIILDATGQDMLTKLDSIISAINPVAQGVSYDNAGTGMVANNVQSAITELKTGLVNTNSSLTQLYYSTNTNQLDSRSIDVSTTVTYNVTPTHNGWLSVQFTTTTGAVELFARIRQGVFGDFFQGTLPSYHVNETFLMIPCKANTAYSVEIKRTNTTSPLTIKVIEAY